MNKHGLVGLLCIFLLASCSTYKTSSKDIIFKGTEFHEKPVIPVGDIKVDSQDMRFLGWIEAFVSGPSMFKPSPTEQQANYVLAHQAKQQGADAVLHLSYKKSFSVTGQSKIVVKGQAIQFKDEREQIVQPEPEAVAKQIDEEQSEQPAIAVIATEASEAQQTDEIETDLAAEATIVAEPFSPIATEDTIEPEAFTEEFIQVSVKAEPVSSSQLVLKREATTPTSTTTAPSALVLKQEKPEPKNISGVQLITHLNQFYDDEMNRMQLMHNNAKILQRYAQKYNDKAMLNAADRLLDQLEQQMQAFKSFAP